MIDGPSLSEEVDSGRPERQQSGPGRVYSRVQKYACNGQYLYGPVTLEAARTSVERRGGECNNEIKRRFGRRRGPKKWRRINFREGVPRPLRPKVSPVKRHERRIRSAFSRRNVTNACDCFDSKAFPVLPERAPVILFGQRLGQTHESLVEGSKASWVSLHGIDVLSFVDVLKDLGRVTIATARVLTSLGRIPTSRSMMSHHVKHVGPIADLDVSHVVPQTTPLLISDPTKEAQLANHNFPADANAHVEVVGVEDSFFGGMTETVLETHWDPDANLQIAIGLGGNVTGRSEARQSALEVRMKTGLDLNPVFVRPSFVRLSAAIGGNITVRRRRSGATSVLPHVEVESKQPRVDVLGLCHDVFYGVLEGEGENSVNIHGQSCFVPEVLLSVPILPVTRKSRLGRLATDQHSIDVFTPFPDSAICVSPSNNLVRTARFSEPLLRRVLDKRVFVSTTPEDTSVCDSEGLQSLAPSGSYGGGGSVFRPDGLETVVVGARHASKRVEHVQPKSKAKPLESVCGTTSCRRINKRDAFTIVFWNQLRSFSANPECFDHFLQVFSAHKDWSMCGISGAWYWKESGIYECECPNGTKISYLWSQSGSPSSKQATGVGLFLSAKARSCLVSFTPFSGRNMVARFRVGRARLQSVVVTYAPTSGQVVEREKYFSATGDVIDNIPLNDFLALIGDFNSRVGRGLGRGSSSAAIGNWGEEHSNAAGARLVQFCEERGLIVANTFFQHKPRHTFSWCGIPKVKNATIFDWDAGRTVADYCIVRRNDLRSLLDVRINPGDDAQNRNFYHSDHHPLTVKLKLRFFFGTRVERNLDGRLDYAALVDPLRPEIAISFADDVESRLSTIGAEKVKLSENPWAEISTVLNEASKSILPSLPKVSRRSQPSDVVKALIASRKEVYKVAVGLSYGGPISEESKVQLRLLRNGIKKQTKQDSHLALQAFTSDLSKAAKLPNKRQFYDVLNTMTGRGKGFGSKITSIKGRDGSDISNSKGIADRFAEHFFAVMNPSSTPDPSTIAEYVLLSEMTEPAPDPPAPSISDTKACILRQKLNKAKDEYGVNSEMIRGALMLVGRDDVNPPLFLLLFHALFVSEPWEAGKFPDTLKRAMLAPLWKHKGLRVFVDNYRGVTVLSIPRRVFVTVVYVHVGAHLESRLPETQCGGRSGRGILDNLFTLRGLQEQAIKFQLPFPCAFLDVAKAFDSVPRILMFPVLGTFGMSRKVVQILIDLHVGTSCRVRVDGKFSDVFLTNGGIQQGATESSMIYDSYMFVCIKPILKQLEALGVDIMFSTKAGSKLSLCSLSDDDYKCMVLSHLLFVDDTTLVAKDVPSMQAGIDLVYAQFKLFGMEFNLQKTECIHFAAAQSLSCGVCDSIKGKMADFIMCEGGCEQNFHLGCVGLAEMPNAQWRCDECGGPGVDVHTCFRDSVIHPYIEVGGTKLNWVQNVKYLGVKISSDCSMDSEITARISAATGAFKSVLPALSRRHGSRPNYGVVTNVFKCIVLSVLLFGCATWALNKSQLNKLEAFQRRCIRMCSPRVPPTLRDGVLVYHTPILSIRLPSIEVQIEKLQLGWLGHLAREEPHRIPQIMLSAVRKGNRSGDHQFASCPNFLCGIGGVYHRLIKKYFTAETKKIFFGGLNPELPEHQRLLRNLRWSDAARNREAWKKFASEAPLLVLVD